MEGGTENQERGNEGSEKKREGGRERSGTCQRGEACRHEWVSSGVGVVTLRDELCVKKGEGEERRGRRDGWRGSKPTFLAGSASVNLLPGEQRSAEGFLTWLSSSSSSSTAF
ncbi:hypothetical protein EYF80_031716 [Liparis tanakae]|uniref:Uncharacterized protein n=1 Tax=Liparis tanakae TaxID=230148 RepID=A0A4Z2GZM2_9TELE|nr:hypothetical protein EYF80_031716 [Liparis tanakae]